MNGWILATILDNQNPLVWEKNSQYCINWIINKAVDCKPLSLKWNKPFKNILLVITATKRLEPSIIGSVYTLTKSTLFYAKCTRSILV